jgi:hypothetical protein
MRTSVSLIAAALLCSVFAVDTLQPPAPAATTSPTPSTNLGNDPNGNPLRLALKTGHVSNYDEAKVRSYTLPDPLVLAGGKAVRNARTWQNERRPEILRLYETEIYGRIPANAPTVKWEVTETDPQARGGRAVMKRIVGALAQTAAAPQIKVTLYTPVSATRPVPIILLVNFGGGPAPPPQSTASAGAPARPIPPDPAVAAAIIDRGWGYATVGYQDIQPDRKDAWTGGVIGLTLTPGQTQPAPDEWGTIGAWAWGISRIIDYLETDRSVDAKRIAIHGHSRLGKTVLWASARDERIAAVFSSCAGEMGSALARRDWGETVDDMAQNFPWQFAGNFQKWPGRWNDMPVDAHMLIALSAPRPVFVTGGTADQWADPVGEFLATVAAGPVYRLLGKKDLGVAQLPPLDTPLTDGDLGWHYHTGGHTATPADWNAFLVFLDKYFGKPAGTPLQAPHAEAPPFKFETQQIRDNFGVGYAVTVADVNGDRRPDVLAINGTQLVWFENPSWTMHVALDGQTPKDNVTFAPHDIDRDGRLDVALGAAWNPKDTTGGGTLHWAARATGETWTLRDIASEPTLHRIRWANVDGTGDPELIVVPLHGRGTAPPEWNGVGPRILVLRVPKDPARETWPVEVADDSLHIVHNFAVIDFDGDRDDDLLTASREGVHLLERGADGRWTKTRIGEGPAGEIKVGRLGGARALATIEPWHGNALVLYREPAGGKAKSLWSRQVLDDTLAGGHAIGWADIDGDENDELVAGWRDKEGGVALYHFAKDGAMAGKIMIDPGGMAAEDLAVADLDADGRPDIVASGRRTSNVRIYWNRTPKR